MSTLMDLTGNVFGRLTVIRRYFPKKLPKWKKNQPQWLCICTCGNKTVVNGRYLREGDTQSCGCIETEGKAKRVTTHGLSGTPEYAIWRGMKNRCYYKKSYKYPDYGGRGIKVCPRWRNSFQNFISDMGKKPSKRHSIDRVDVDGNYEPSNCRWATSKQQGKNKRNNHWVTYKNKTKIVSHWAKFFKVHLSSLQEMMTKHSFEYIYAYYTKKNKAA